VLHSQPPQFLCIHLCGASVDVSHSHGCLLCVRETNL
jgi:hypothetical protein